MPTRDEKPRRRLPVLGASSAADDAARPRWHWPIIVALGTLFGWLLLEMIVAGPVTSSRIVGAHPLAVAAIHLGALALPAAGAAALAGRTGKNARGVDAVLGAVGLVAGVSALSLLRLGSHELWAIASTLAAAAAGAGASLGFAWGRRRPAPEA